jgi:hypothetical protein
MLNFWVVAPCCLVGRHQDFAETCFYQLSALKMKTWYFPETFVSPWKSTWHYCPDQHNIFAAVRCSHITCNTSENASKLMYLGTILRNKNVGPWWNSSKTRLNKCLFFSFNSICSPGCSTSGHSDQYLCCLFCMGVKRVLVSLREPHTWGLHAFKKPSAQINILVRHKCN